MIAPQFLSINGTSVKLNDIKPVGDDVNTTGGISIQLLGVTGVPQTSYVWFDMVGFGTGWHDGSAFVADAVTFEPGQGLWVTGTGTGASLQFSGKVGTSDISVQLKQGAIATGNPFPTSIKLNSIIPTGENVNTTGGISIQIVGTTGVPQSSYVWFDMTGFGTGWHDGINFVTDAVTFEPGQGLWVTGTSATEQFIYFPAPKF